MRGILGHSLLFRSICFFALVAPTMARAQEISAGTVRLDIAEENLRASPNGVRIAVVLPAARLAAGPVHERWRPVTLSGWVAADAVSATTRDGYALVVDEADIMIMGEPAGVAIARALEGLLLNEVERRDGWVHVTRSGWVWDESLTAAQAQVAAPPAEPRTVVGNPVRPGSARAILAEPGGDTIAKLTPGADMEVLSKDGGWTRVRVEGWISTPDGEIDTGAVRDLSLKELKEDPSRYQGREVVWNIQFVALQQADSIRTDLQAGEWYILGRDPNGVPGFAYIVVSGDQIAAARSLYPLQKFTMRGRIRSGSSRITGHPVIELIEISSSSP